MTIDGLAKIMQQGFKSIDARFEKMATKDFVEKSLAKMAAKDDLVNFATKDDLENGLDNLAAMVHRGFLETASKAELKDVYNKLNNRMEKIECAVKHNSAIIEQHESKISFLKEDVVEIQKVLSLS